MSRRKILVLASTSIVVALALGCYVPQYFSPIPELVQQLHACLEPMPDQNPTGDVDPSPKIPVEFCIPRIDLALLSRPPVPCRLQEAPDPDARPHIQVDLRVISFNTTKAGTALFADRVQDGAGVGGLVKDGDRVTPILERLLNREHCGSILALPRMTTVPGQTAQFISGGEVAVLSADGVSVEFQPYGTLVKFTATPRKNGLIHVGLKATRSEPKEVVTLANGTSVVKGFDSVNAEASLALTDGQTAFIVSPTRKAKGVENVPVPLLGDLPQVGSWFSFRREFTFDEQLLILATPSLVREVEAPAPIPPPLAAPAR